MKALWTALIVFSLVGNAAEAVQTCPNAGPRSAPDSRYTNNGNGTVTDNQSGLMWKQCSEGQAESTCNGMAARMSWEEALKLGKGVSYADFNDWRLPSVDELKTLVETACIDPSINESYFANTFAGGYWTSSGYAADDDYVWYVDFHTGRSSFNGTSSHYGVRLVRDAK